MEHEALREDLSAYLDGELAAERKAEVQAHIGACEACRRELESLKSAAARFREAGKVRAPAGLEKAVLGEPAAPRRRPSLAFAAGLAAVVLILYGVGVLLRPQLSQIFDQVMGMISGAASSVSGR